jgi:hypothetical protein
MGLGQKLITLAQPQRSIRTGRAVAKQHPELGRRHRHVEGLAADHRQRQRDADLHAAERIAAAVLAGSAPASAVTVRVRKPEVPLPGVLAWAGVEIRRTR